MARRQSTAQKPPQNTDAGPYLASAPVPASPPIPSLLAGLGLHGLGAVEPVVLAALATESPSSLSGPLAPRKACSSCASPRRWAFPGAITMRASSISTI